MYKLLFEIIKSPLGLPISPIFEYIILLVINEIVFQVAWRLSPGGRSGSRIHWSIRIPLFILLWALTYAVIVLVKWIKQHWIVALIIAILIGVLVLIIGLFIHKRNDKNNEKKRNER